MDNETDAALWQIHYPRVSGLTAFAGDGPDWLAVPFHMAKELDLWYWNWQFPSVGQPDRIVPAMEYLKQRFGCELAFHWHGSNGEAFGSGWRMPEEFPDNADIRETVRRGVRRLHASGIHCIPYINGRLWNPNTASFKAADGVQWAVTDREGKAAREGDWLGYTICPTAPRYQQLIARVTNQMIDGCEMDGAYLDQISSAHSLPCFHPAHNHPPGGHDHWTRGYREMLEKVQVEIKRRSPGNVITSESVIEGCLDRFDLDLAREISNLKGHLGSPALLPIPMFHSVYHDFHMTYGTVQTFKETDLARFRFAEALCLVGGGQLMISGFFPGDEEKEKFKPHFDYMETLTKAHIAGRRWLNLGVWKPPLAVQCDRVDVPFSITEPPKKNLPAILNGCFGLGGELCIVLVNHTAEPRTGSVRLDPRALGIAGAAFQIAALSPGASAPRAGDFSTAFEWRMELPPASAQTFVLRPVK